MNRSTVLLRRWALAVCASALLGAAPAVIAQTYNYIAPAELKQRLESADKPLLLDIQVEADYAKHRLPGAVPTYAYPAKTDAERAKLQPVVGRILSSKEDVVIVCPGGGSGARNTYDFLKSQGVPENRMRILEKGQKVAVCGTGDQGPVGRSGRRAASRWRPAAAQGSIRPCCRRPFSSFSGRRRRRVRFLPARSETVLPAP